jgi:two-component system sensor histidine kinase SenX3
VDDTARSQELFLFLASTAHDMKNSISVLSGTLERLLVDAVARRDESATIRRWRRCCTRPSA